MQQRLIYSVLFLIVGLLFSCGRDPLKVDTSGVDVQIEFVQLDAQIWSTPAADLPALRSKLANQLGEINDYHFGYILSIGRVSDTAFVNAVEAYKSDEAIKKMQREVELNFADLSKEQNQLKEAFTRVYAMHDAWGYPKQIVWHNSLFQASVFCTETQLAIGMERYLGVSSPTVKSLPSEPFYDWIKAKFDRQFMIRDAVFNWFLTNVVDTEEGVLAERMINYGKALLLTEAALPEIEKHIIARYSADEYKWAIDNEGSFWKFLVDTKGLFKSDEKAAASYFNDAPFTSGLPEKAPDRLGQFLGWRMVQQYVKKNKVEWEDLLTIPYNKILQNYKID